MTTYVMVKRSDCSNRIAVTKQQSSCLGRDGSGRPPCGLDQVAGPWTVRGCFAPVIRPKHGVGRTSSLPGRSIRDLPMLAGIKGGNFGHDTIHDSKPAREISGFKFNPHDKKTGQFRVNPFDPFNKRVNFGSTR
ncbi:unnamed protein product [Prunus armeniaca]